MSEHLFLSDLHLDPARPGITDAFLDFLAQRAPRAEAVYILGDLFEVWIGDDDPSPLARTVAGQLHALAAAGVRVHLLRGNRDFLIGETFAVEAGLTLLEDPTALELHGVRTVLSHGDALCTDDVEYQAFRAKVREPAWQAAFLAQPLAVRARAARELREASRRRSREKPEAIMDVNPAAVRELMARQRAQRLIHGHTHRPGRHRLALPGGQGERLVLGAWDEAGGILVRVDAAGAALERFRARAAAFA
ncbi:UDP-2,3-diacylglucosamine diphosphatase [Inmirania thermothiophila]|uniref:UDP-2,3-diacylglucosamine hydrolase n=1 Tax=Inmirania thermothiophila TaxID=1750597 RepID=A0A3N1Y2F6_9GAMM|nr:UDP-2,3-diacylglucosamine diphosphatase [Inmirania thermothiophila]ROR32711.1 UDP-2,3-diacylglucosamine hydrolase [Inmirania thermothiophila]